MEETVRRRFEKIEGILQEVAERQMAADARMDRMDARMDRVDARFEKRMRGFEKLVKIGMRQLVQLGAKAKETDQKIHALIDSQLRTEASLRTLIASQRGRNGRDGRNN
jgi:hypothetical protein